MKSYLKSLKKENCTGCSACKNICPKNAIEILEDDEGFLYPVIDKSKCIKCHLCEKVCPINSELQKVNPVAYSYITNSNEDLLKASSGGAFGDIIDAFYEKNNTVIYGVVFDKENKAMHIGTKELKNIEKMKKSKYVQSNMNNVLKQIKKNLIDGYKVIFSGTPCQVAALKKFLNRDYDTLLCIDIVCHGVPNQRLLDYYIEEENKKNKSKLKHINFREKIKKDNGKFESRNIKMIFENGTTVIKSIRSSSYLKGFHSRLFYRPSCYECKFASIDRYSDITIADCWELDKIENGADPHKGISSVILNTQKGKMVFEKMKGKKKKIPIEFIIENNSAYTKPTKLHKNRNKFFKKLNNKNFSKLVYKYTKTSIIKRTLNYIKRNLINKSRKKK